MKLAFKHQLSHVSLNVITAVLAILIAATGIFIVSLTFDLNPFNERTSQFLLLAFFSLIGMASAGLMLNIAANLSIMADQRMKEVTETSSSTRLKYWFLGVGAAFLMGIGIILLAHEDSDAKVFELVKVQSEKVLAEQQSLVNEMANLVKSNDPGQLRKIPEILKFIESRRADLPSLILIYPGTFNNQRALYQLESHSLDANQGSFKASYYTCRENIDCDYLNEFFNGQKVEKRNHKSKTKNDFSVYYPFEIDGQKFILLFSRWQNYGKYGS